MIRPYLTGDASALALIHSTVFPDNPLSTAAFKNNIAAMLAAGGMAWTIALEQPIGYALTVPVPGLPHIADLNGCIAPDWQRQGYGSRLLSHVLTDLRPSAVRQVAYQARDLNSAAARFLQKNGFFVEHEEWLMVRDNLLNLPEPLNADAAEVITYARAAAVSHFDDLFKRSFGGQPWYQPFSQREIEQTLADQRDILFLIADSQPIGFAWLHLESGGLGVIEPLGVLPAYQRQGYGRMLLLAALGELAQRGVGRAQIGAWRSNQPAVQLYQSLGFIHRQTITFLAHDLPA